MPLKDFQSGQMKRTVAEVNEAEREESAQFWRSFRKFVLGYLLGFVTCLLLLG